MQYAHTEWLRRFYYLRSMNLVWKLKDWNELSKEELYEVLALRVRVFVIEQNCPYQDVDGKDLKSLHLFAEDETGKCVACLRLVKPGVSYEEWSIGRVATDLSVRTSGVGKELMRRGMAFFDTVGNPPVRISAQSYLKEFYENFGFKQVSEEYLEDDIPHIEMLYTLQNI